MSAFVETSGIIALSNPDDASRGPAAQTCASLPRIAERLHTTNYVVAETMYLLHRRDGAPAVRRFTDDVLPAATVDWVGEEVRDPGAAAVLAGSRRGPSLVDCTSFERMRRRHLTEALAFDDCFTDRGCRLPETDAGPLPSDSP